MALRRRDSRDATGVFFGSRDGRRMMSGRRSGIGRFCLGAVGLSMTMAMALPAETQAQTEWAIKRAERMESEAESLADQRDEWKKAAWLYREAASLRPQGDPEAVDDLEWAARLAYYTRDVRQSLEDLELAGERAMEGGDVFTAANLLLDAAWVANRLDQSDRARQLVLRAEEHAMAPVLSLEVRNSVLDRITEDRAVAVVGFLRP